MVNEYEVSTTFYFNNSTFDNMALLQSCIIILLLLNNAGAKFEGRVSVSLVLTLKWILRTSVSFKNYKDIVSIIMCNCFTTLWLIVDIKYISLFLASNIVWLTEPEPICYWRWINIWFKQYRYNFCKTKYLRSLF